MSKEQIYQDALRNIQKHVEVVAGSSMTRHNTIWNIANNALIQTPQEEKEQWQIVLPATDPGHRDINVLMFHGSYIAGLYELRRLFPNSELQGEWVRLLTPVPPAINPDELNT